MRANFYLSFVLLAIVCLFVSPAHAQEKARRDMQLFEHVAVSLNAGTTGFGLQGATPVHPNIAVRAGFSTLPISYSYTYNGVGEIDALEGTGYEYIDFSVPLKAKSSMFNGKILVDFFPQRDSRFHITAGLYFGNSKIIKVNGYTDVDFPIEIGDIWILPDIDGRVSASIKTNAVKPYVGLGFGRTIPRTRVGFKFELGGIFQGSPKAESPTLANIPDLDVQGEVDDFNKFLNDYFKVYPVLNFQLSYRIF